MVTRYHVIIAYIYIYIHTIMMRIYTVRRCVHVGLCIRHPLAK